MFILALIRFSSFLADRTNGHGNAKVSVRLSHFTGHKKSKTIAELKRGTAALRRLATDNYMYQKSY